MIINEAVGLNTSSKIGSKLFGVVANWALNQLGSVRLVGPNQISFIFGRRSSQILISIYINLDARYVTLVMEAVWSLDSIQRT